MKDTGNVYCYGRQERQTFMEKKDREERKRRRVFKVVICT